MGNVKKSVAKRTRHKRQYDRRMNERQMQSRESKVVSSKSLDASLVVTECSGTNSNEHITGSSSGTYIIHVANADIRPVKCTKCHLPEIFMIRGSLVALAVPPLVRYLSVTFFTLVGNKCPLTRFTSTKIVPPRKLVKSTAMKNIKPSSASQLRPRETKHMCSSSEPKIVEARTTNHLEPNKNRGSNVSISPCSSSVQCSSCLSPQCQMVSADYTLGPAPHRKEMCTLQYTLSSKEEKSSYLRAVLSIISIRSHARSGLVQNPVSLTPYVPPSKKDYEILFQLLIDEYFNHLPRVVSPDPVVVTVPRAVEPVGSPSSSTIDQDVPSANPSSEEMTLQGVIPSNLHHLNKSFDTLTKLIKNHPLENVIGDPSRPVSTKSQLQEHAIWCYFDANDNPIPFDRKRSG
ncbi:hypothetical protein Tco_0639556 [Tanacetum coccineum]